MKARIPPKIPKQLKQEAERIAKNAYEQIREKENKDITRRVFKTMLYALHKDFGFGRDRCAKALKSMTEIIEHSDTDEVFWEHIDRVVIDGLKLEFDKRDYTDNGKVVNFEEENERLYLQGVIMREYLFRGKTVDNEEWVQGYLYRNCRTIRRYG